MKRRRMGVTTALLVVVAIGALAAGALKQKERKILESEREQLREAAEKARRAKAENERLLARRTSDEMVAALRKESAAIARLRSEVEQLKRTAAAPKPAMTPMPATAPMEAKHLAEQTKRWGFGADEAARLKAMLAARRAAAMEVVNRARSEGQDPNGVNVREAAARATEEQEMKIRAWLGEGRYPEFQTSEWRASAERVAKQMERVLEKTPTPLGREQRDFVVDLLARHHAGGAVVRATGEPLYRIRVTDAVVAEAKTVLAPGQLRALEMFRGR